MFERRLEGGSGAVEEAVLGYLTGLRRNPMLAQQHLLGTGEVAALEARLRDYYGMRHALALANASVGLFALALALELDGSEVVAPPLGWGGAVGALRQAGCRIIFADVDPVTLTLCPEALRRAITPATRAILAVDLFGVPADDVALRRIAEEHGLWYLHDAAQSLGARRVGRASGAHAHALVTSFTAGKPLFAGEGGAVLTDDDRLFEQLVWLTQHPYRQKRELGLARTNPFALNLRIHPLAAVWAAADFPAALRRVARHRRRVFDLLEELEVEGSIAPLPYRARKLRPTFYRVTCLCPGGNHRDLTASLLMRGLDLDLTPIVELLPGAGGCAVAAAQAERRVELVLPHARIGPPNQRSQPGM